MGKMRIFEVFEDFISATKGAQLKEVFYSVNQKVDVVDAMLGNQPIKATRNVSSIKMTACSDDGKVFVTHTFVAGEFLSHQQTSQAEVDDYSAKVKGAVEETIKRVQRDYPSATLIYGSCLPITST